MTQEQKMELFKEMLKREMMMPNGSLPSYTCEYTEDVNFGVSQGIWKTLVILGLDSEYIQWSNGKQMGHEYVPFKGETFFVEEYNPMDYVNEI